jgi:Protein of unknown function (DUF4236)
MGWSYRKSFSDGLFRATISQSGISTSFGVKGARITSGLRGTYVTIGSGGFFYRKRIDLPRNISEDKNKPNFQMTPVLSSDEAVITYGDINQLRSASPKELLTEIEEKHTLTSFIFPINILCGIGSLIIFLLQTPLLFFLWIPTWIALGIWANRQDFQRKNVSIFYSLDDSVTRSFEKMGEGVHQLSTSEQMWWIATESAVSDRKRNAGASSTIKRSPASAALALPAYFVTNIEIPSISAGGIVLYFFPDKILVYQGVQVAALHYQQLSFSVDKTRFIESDNVPSDSRKVGSTWQYVNKNGSPDRRFKNNYQIPIMEYGGIFITGKGLTISLHISKLEAAFAFVKRIEEFQSTVRPQTIESVKARFNEITNHHKTLEKITHIVHSSPITVQDLIKRAEARVQSDDKLGAVTDLTEAIRLDPNDAVIYYMRGMLRKELGDSIGADDDFQKVIGM